MEIATFCTLIVLCLVSSYLFQSVRIAWFQVGTTCPGELKNLPRLIKRKEEDTNDTLPPSECLILAILACRKHGSMVIIILFLFF